jgi:ABC-type nitrate/sulfonate/bicarbonate transport system substrate-binding protein
VAVFQTKYNQVMVVPKEVDKPEQLRGKLVGLIDRPSVNGLGTISSLKLYGLQPDKDYQIRETGSNGTYQALTAALIAGQVYAAGLQPDFARKATADGKLKILYDVAKLDLNAAGSSLTFRTPFVQEHPAEVQKVVDSLIQGERYYKEHPDEAKSILKTMFKIDDPVDVEEQYERQKLLVASDPTPRKELYPDLIEAIATVNPEVKGFDPEKLIEPRFVQDAIKRGVTP